MREFKIENNSLNIRALILKNENLATKKIKKNMLSPLFFDA